MVRNGFIKLGLAAAVVLQSFSAVSASPTAGGEMPIMPVISEMRHWDNHWFIWLPQDRTYEAVEVMSLNRDPSGKPLVWAFFTERAGDKHQVHYVNNAAWARRQHWIFTPISYEATGADRGPRGLEVAFIDRDHRSVRIHVSVAGAAPLTSAGLTNQIGHSADSIFLMFYRAQNTESTDWRVTLGGEIISQPGPSYVAPFRPAYSRDIATALFPFQTETVRFHNRSRMRGFDLVFQRARSPDRYVATPVESTRKVLETTDAGHLASYSDHDGQYILRIAFAHPLPPPCTSAASMQSRFSISIEGRDDLLDGTVLYSGGPRTTLRWRFDKPTWAADRKLTSVIAVDCRGGVQKAAVSNGHQ